MRKILLPLMAILLFIACKRSETNPTNPDLATITTTVPSSVSSTTASSGGNITSDGRSTITTRGVCWSIGTNPTIANIKTDDGTGTGTFTSSLTGLSANTIYHLRAYATNSVGTAYGSEVSFTTSANLATITTTAITAITLTTAMSGGDITSDGGASIIERGICFATTNNPNTSNSKVVSGSGIGNFTAPMSGLIAGTTYYVRAYGINIVGTAYGNVVNFFVPYYEEVTIGTQVWRVKNLDVSTYRNGDPIPQVTDQTAWDALTTGAWCYYNNDSANGAIYGKLYNWYAVIDPRGLAPTGWHVPTFTEWWTTLSNYLGGFPIAGGKMKTTGTIEGGTGLWNSPNTGATNSSGFTAIPAGQRLLGTSFDYIGKYGYWWSTTDVDINSAWRVNVGYNFAGLNNFSSSEGDGFSVRCIKD